MWSCYLNSKLKQIKNGFNKTIQLLLFKKRKKCNNFVDGLLEFEKPLKETWVDLPSRARGYTDHNRLHIGENHLHFISNIEIYICYKLNYFYDTNYSKFYLRFIYCPCRMVWKSRKYNVWINETYWNNWKRAYNVIIKHKGRGCWKWEVIIYHWI